MGRGSNTANTAATSAQTLSNTNAGQAGALFSTLSPQLMAESVNPQGFDPATIAKMKTDAMQSAGGSAAAAVGQGALRAARTRNVGAQPAATAAGIRSAGETLSKENLGTDIANERLKQQQRQSAQSELGNLFGISTGAGVNALGEVAQNVNANTNAANQSWDWAKYILDPAMQAASGASRF